MSKVVILPCQPQSMILVPLAYRAAVDQVVPAADGHYALSSQKTRRTDRYWWWLLPPEGQFTVTMRFGAVYWHALMEGVPGCRYVLGDLLRSRGTTLVQTELSREVTPPFAVPGYPSGLSQCSTDQLVAREVLTDPRHWHGLLSGLPRYEYTPAEIRAVLGIGQGGRNKEAYSRIMRMLGYQLQRETARQMIWRPL